MARSSSHAKIIDITESGITDKIDLTISIEKACFIIIKAREFDVKVPPVEEDPASNPADMQKREILEDYASDSTYAELRDAINALNDDEKADLVALLWIGRGDFDAAGWDQARAQAFQEQHHVARYLTGNPLLGDLLEEGLNTIGYSCEELDIDRL